MMEKMNDENGQEWEVGYDEDYIPGYDDGECEPIMDGDGEWDPIMGDSDEWAETDDEWLDDFAGEEDFG